jgi:hypothetical protein
MPRKEFSKAIKVAAIKRATRDGVTYCEMCGAIAKRYEVDHANPDGLTGEPTLANAVIACVPCHASKTKQDVSAIAKAKRREAKALGVRKPPTLKSAPFTPAEPQRKATRTLSKDMPPRRGMYQEIEP